MNTQTISKSLVIVLGFIALAGFTCEVNEKFTCSRTKGWGHHEITTVECESSNVKVLDGQIYVKNAKDCKKTTKKYTGSYDYYHYTGDKGHSFDVDASEIGDLIKGI